MEAFRQKGYDGTSLDDISAATGLTRPSLYAAFGDKLAMYLAALAAFADRTRNAAHPALQKGATAEEALSRFFTEMLRAYFAGRERGCLVFGTAPGAAHLSEVQGELQRYVRQTDRAMQDRFVELLGKQDKQSARAAAEAATNTLIGLSVRARAGTSHHELRQMARRASRLIGKALEAQH